MTARRVLIWRHGRTGWNASGRIQGQADVLLDPVGVAQVEEAAPLLAAEAPDVIVASDLARARHTADALAALTGLPVRLDARLRETAFGPWQGLTQLEIAQRWPEAYERWQRGEPPGLPGMERPEQVAARMRLVIEDVLAATEGTLVVVTHGGAARRAVQALLGWPDEVVVRLGVLGNCRWTELRHTARGWRLHAHNAGPLAGVAGAAVPVATADVEPAAGEVLTSSPTPR
ncbi:MAG TPA: histidine phosphatase family protein [Cryptosporangiaceae bacterium]|nr:histidine phosphatase family protein [Cryptosporangiaceae bacterium]